MTDTCIHCDTPVGEQHARRTLDAACPNCGKLFWLGRGQVLPCKVTRIARLGVFVELGDGVEGLVQISELARATTTDPAEVVAVGDIVRAKVLRIDMDARKVGLSIKRLQ